MHSYDYCYSILNGYIPSSIKPGTVEQIKVTSIRSKETTQRQCLRNKVRGVNRRTSAHLRSLGAIVIF